MATAVNVDPVDQLETLLQCSICLEIFNHPRTLPCHHTFCKVCLLKFVKANRKNVVGDKVVVFNCPDCRSEFSLQSDHEVEGMGSSHFIRNMIDVLSIQRQVKEKTVSCTRCQQPAVCRCCTCDMFMCEKCLEAHESFSAMKKHNVLTLSEVSEPENQAKLKPRQHCTRKNHENKELKYYCETCEELICKHCMNFDHTRPSHLSHLAADVAEKQRQLLRTQCQTLQQSFSNTHQTLKCYSEIKETLKDNTKKAKQEILEHKHEIIRKITKLFDDKAKHLMNQIDEEFKEANDALTEQQTEVEDYLEKIKAPLKMAKNLVENGNDEEILSSQKLVKENVEKLEDNEVSKPENIKPVHDGHIAYERQINEDEVVGCVRKLTEKMGNIGCHPIPHYFKLHKTSTILTNQPVKYTRQLQQWVGDQFEWRCCYRASRDGWNPIDFHRQSDGVGPTVTLVKVKDYIFGGYTDQDWAGDYVYKSSHNSFLFSLHNKDNLPPFVAPLKPGHDYEAIYCCPSLGPTFGGATFLEGGPDLSISVPSPCDYSSSSDFGLSYQLPFDYNFNDDRTQSLLAGSGKFTPSEIEVFH